MVGKYESQQCNLYWRTVGLHNWPTVQELSYTCNLHCRTLGINNSPPVYYEQYEQCHAKTCLKASVQVIQKDWMVSPITPSFGTKPTWEYDIPIFSSQYHTALLQVYHFPIRLSPPKLIFGQKLSNRHKSHFKANLTRFLGMRQVLKGKSHLLNYPHQVVDLLSKNDSWKLNEIFTGYSLGPGASIRVRVSHSWHTWHLPFNMAVLRRKLQMEIKLICKFLHLKQTIHLSGYFQLNLFCIKHLINL